MDYHLKSIEQFVSTYLKPNESFINRMNQACVEDIILKMIIEIEKVKIFISQSYYSFDEERKCEQFIRNHQRRIVIIINQVNKGIRENSIGSNAKYRVQNELMEHLNASMMNCLLPLTLEIKGRTSLLKQLRGFMMHFFTVIPLYALRWNRLIRSLKTKKQIIPIAR